MGPTTSNEGRRSDRRKRVAQKDDPASVTRFKSAAAKRLKAHRRPKRMGLRCLTVRVSDRTVHHLISTGYLALESGKVKTAVAIALEAWIYDNVP